MKQKRWYGLRWTGLRTVVFAVPAVAVGGCASDGAATPETASAVPRTGRLAPGVDPDRAFKKLSELLPAIEAPVRAETLRPLSARSQRQVTRATDLIAQQRFTEASIALERALRFDPDHPDVHRVLATLHWRAGNVERARTHAARSLEENPDDAVAQYVYARCQLRNGLVDSALVALRTALLCSDFGEDTEAAALTHYYLAQQLDDAGHLTAALEQYDRFTALSDARSGIGAIGRPPVPIISGGRAAAAEARATILERLGRLAEAADALRDLVDADPEDTSLGKRFVRLLAGAGRYDEALVAARKVPAFDEEFISLLTEIYSRIGRPDGLVDELRGRLAMQPHVPRLATTLADVLLRTDRRGEAIEVLWSFLEANADAHDVRSRLVDLLLAKSRWADALSVCADGIRLAPERFDELSAPILALGSDPRVVDLILTAGAGNADHHIGHFLRGSLALAVGRREDSERFLKKSNVEDPRFVPTRVSLGRLYLQQYRYDEALEILRDSEEDPATGSSALALVRARVYDRLDDAPQAMRHYRAVLQLDPDDIEAMLDSARLHLRFREELQAQRILRLVLERSPDHEDAYELLAQAYRRGDKHDLAHETYAQLQQRTTSPTTAARCRVQLDRDLAGNPQAQRTVLLDAIEQGTPDAKTWVAVAQTYPGHELAERRATLEKALALDPEEVDVAYWLALTEMRTLEFESAARRLVNLLRRHPNRHAWRHQLIDAYSLLFRDDEALGLARRALAETSLPAREREAYRGDVEDVLSRAGRGGELLSEMRRWLESDPDDAALRRRLGLALWREQRYADAAGVFKELLEREPADLQARQWLVTSLRDADRSDRAEQWILGWLEDDPENDHSVSLLGSHLVARKRFDEVSVLIREHLGRTANREWYQGFWLRALNAEKRYGDAVELAERLLDVAMTVLHGDQRLFGARWRDHVRHDEIPYYPNAPFPEEALLQRVASLQLQLGAELVFNKQYHRAERDLNNWLEVTREPDLRARFLLLLSTCYTQQGHLEKAADAMERAHLITPDDPTRSNDLAYQWIDRGVRLDDAEPLIRYALGRIPQNAAYLDTFGWLLYKKGEFEAARTWLRRASRARRREDPVILDHLGDACWRLGLVDEAVQHWSKAKDLVADRQASELVNEDERRVQQEVAAKIDAARGGDAIPKVAPLAVEPKQSDGDKGDDDA